MNYKRLRKQYKATDDVGRWLKYHKQKAKPTTDRSEKNENFPMTTEEALNYSDSGDRMDEDPVAVLAEEVRRLRDIMSDPAKLRGHVNRQFPEYAWENIEHYGKLRATTEELEQIKLECKTAREDRDEARRLAEAYREVWEMVSVAVDQTQNPDPLPWANVANEPRADRAENRNHG